MNLLVRSGRRSLQRAAPSVRDGDVVLLNGHDDAGPLLLDVDSEEYPGADTVLLAKRCIQGDVAQITFGEDCAGLLVVELDDGFARIEAVDKPGVGLYMLFLLRLGQPITVIVEIFPFASMPAKWSRKNWAAFG